MRSSRVGLVALTVSLTACSTYSDFINSFGPDRRISDLREGIEAPVQLTQRPVPTETYIVMPEDGKVGTVVVTLEDGSEHVLQGDYSGMSLAGGQTETFDGDAEQVDELFGDAVAALPAAPYDARLYFLLDKDELTPESKIQAQQVFDEITGRQIAEIQIVGHTDTVASIAYNEKLSERRAQKVRQALIELGVSDEIIKTSGMGESELLVETADNTPEPKNRRVEIKVR